MNKKNTLAVFIAAYICAFSSTQLLAQQYNYRPPLDIPMLLSANFGELRGNHFHSGIDIKTQGVENKLIKSVEDGYISRIKVSPWGYGLALYIDHPTGHTSVYGHLNRYADKIAKFVKAKQYEQERYNVDIMLSPTDLPVKKGELVAYSGNTGGSFGPHLHFEFRKSENQEALDPLVYYKNEIKDNQPPLIKGIAIYPIKGEGAVSGSSAIRRFPVTLQKGDTYSTLPQPINVWGKIGVGIYSVDKMDGTRNVYGVKKVDLYCNDALIFSSDIKSILFEQTRMINSFTDYNHWKNNKFFYMKSFVEPGNKLPIYGDLSNNGYIKIDSEKEYNLKYVLEDAFGNKTKYSFTLTGKQADIPKAKLCTQAMQRTANNLLVADEFILNVTKNKLYTDVGFVLDKIDNEKYLSKTFMVHNEYIPLDSSARMAIKIENDTLQNKKQYGLISFDLKNKISWAGGKYDEGYIETDINELGNKYAVYYDNVAPVITAINPEKWVQNKKISIKVIDNLSGVLSYRGTIDGKYALFEHDGKSPLYHYYFDDEKLELGKEHELKFVVKDACDNENEYTYKFTH